MNAYLIPAYLILLALAWTIGGGVLAYLFPPVHPRGPSSIVSRARVTLQYLLAAPLIGLILSLQTIHSSLQRGRST